MRIAITGILRIPCLATTQKGSEKVKNICKQLRLFLLYIYLYLVLVVVGDVDIRITRSRYS